MTEREREEQAARRRVLSAEQQEELRVLDRDIAQLNEAIGGSADGTPDYPVVTPDYCGPAEGIDAASRERKRAQDARLFVNKDERAKRDSRLIALTWPNSQTAARERAKQHADESARQTARMVLDFVCAAAVVAGLGFIIWVLLTVSGCTPASSLPPPCDPLTLADGAMQCRALVRAQCPRSDSGAVDESCAVLKQCDKWVDDWHACRADAGTGGEQ